jgi:cytochrome c oxidase assembly factor CtaG
MIDLAELLVLVMTFVGFGLGYMAGVTNRRAAQCSEPVSRAWVSGFRAGLDASWSDVEVVRHD